MKINLPQLPGVYIYKNKNNKIIYIGKAINLKKRVSQYFDKTQKLGPKTQELVKNIFKIEYKIVGSEIEALVLESSLIKKHNPKYNSQLKDNKSYLYINIDKNRITTTRRFGTYGPFPSGNEVKTLLKNLRHIFPFYSTPSHKKTCFYCHLGLCPKNEKENKKNLNMIKKILSGKSKRLLYDLRSKISKLVKSEEYEKAIPIRNALKALEYISFGWKNLSVMFNKIELSSDLAIQSTSELESVLSIPHINRIECYDISQLGQKYFVGAMSVFQNGKIDNGEYRKFKINNTLIHKSSVTFGASSFTKGALINNQSPFRKGNTPRMRGEGFTANDPLMLKEIISRRMRHTEWPYPDLIVLDGGIPQLSTIHDLQSTICFIGLVKNIEKIVIFKSPLVKKESKVFNPPFVKGEGPQGGGFINIVLPKHSLALQLLQQLRDEAHRFANKYRKTLINV